MNWVRLVLFGLALVSPPIVATAWHQEAVNRNYKMQETLDLTRSQVQRLVDLRAQVPPKALSDTDDTQLVATVRNGLRRAGVPDVSIRDISTRRAPARSPDEFPSVSVEATLSACPLPLLGSVIRELVSDTPDPKAPDFALQSLTMTRPPNSQAGTQDFSISLTLSPTTRREIMP